MADKSVEQPTEEAPVKRQRGFPSPATILIGVIVLVWLVTFLIPSGRYELDENGSPMPGSWHSTTLGLNLMDRLGILALSPANGLYGIRSAETGFVAPFGVGTLFGGAQVFLFILAIGGFMTVVFKTNALNLGIAHLAKRFSERGPVLIIILSILFGVLGSVMSWSDETLGFYALIVPLMVGLGYDRLVAVAVITVAPFVGVIGSTVNPFRIGVASDRAGITMGDGLGLRVVLLVLVMAVMIYYTLRYATRVRRDPATSVCGFNEDDRQILASKSHDSIEPLTGRHKVLIGLVAFTFVLMTFSIIPWGAILRNTATDDATGEYIVGVPYDWELGWWLPELTVLFLVMGIVVGMVGRLGEKETVGQFLRGVADFSGPAVLVVLAKSVAVIMTNTDTIDTVLNGMEEFVSGRSSFVFILLLIIVGLPLSFLVGSGSAGMALVMPILAPLGDFAGIDRAVVITVYNAVGGWLLILLPTNALLVAGLALAKVGYNTYLKWIWKLMLLLFGVVVGASLVGVAV